MRRLLVLPALAFVVLSCSEDPLQIVHGIVSGQNQTVVAGTEQLPEAVAWKLARNKDGSITGHWIDPLLPKYAHAQGSQVVVNGSPVPGAVVCVQEVPHLVPFVRCTNTDANGLASFFIEVATTAKNTYRAEIRGTLEGSPAVFDTIVARVEAGPADPNLSWNWTPLPSPAILHATSVSDAFGNVIPFRIVSDGKLTVQGDSVGTVQARTVTFTAASLDSTGIVELRGADNVLLGRAGYRFIISDDRPAILFRVRGTNLMP